LITVSIFSIPPEVKAGLSSGDLIRTGGTVRNQQGKIVKLLEPVKVRPGVVATLVFGVTAAGLAVGTVRKRSLAGNAEMSAPKHAETLVNVVADTTQHLAEAESGPLEDPQESVSTSGAVTDVLRHL